MHKEITFTSRLLIENLKKSDDFVNLMFDGRMFSSPILKGEKEGHQNFISQGKIISNHGDDQRHCLSHSERCKTQNEECPWWSIGQILSSTTSTSVLVNG